MQAEITDAAVKVSPPVAVTGLSIAGLPLSDWVYILTAVYITFQIVCIVPRAWRILRGAHG
jgi:hypothetical protein